MRLILAALVAAFFLAACGIVAQVEPQQTNGITVDMVEPTAECHVEAEATEGAVVFTASDACADGNILPFRIVEADGPEILHDGGVYAGAQTTWHARPGTFNIVRDDLVLGTIAVP